MDSAKVNFKVLLNLEYTQVLSFMKLVPCTILNFRVSEPQSSFQLHFKKCTGLTPSQISLKDGIYVLIDI